MANNIVPNSFVAISDFHSFEWPLAKVINHYIDEYETIYILGDAIDRGPTRDGAGGIKLLSEIKELSEYDEERIIYIPGNHDSFLYDYGYYNDEYARRNMVRNGGDKTQEEFELMKRDNPSKALELLKWLGNLPLQRRHEYNDQKYALAHAFFNNNLYNDNPNFSLDNLYKAKNDTKLYNHLLEVIWFRKENDAYNLADVPSNDTIVIIGHTPELYREDQSLDLENINDEMVTVHCVDGGIAYNGKMLKYDGGYKPIDTIKYSHNNTSPTNGTQYKKL